MVGILQWQFWLLSGRWTCIKSENPRVVLSLSSRTYEVLRVKIQGSSHCGSKRSQDEESVQSLSRVWLRDPTDCSTPGFPVHHQLPELAQTHVHWVCDAIQPSHPLWSPSPPAFNLSQHQGLFQWVSSLHQVAKVLELPLQHQSFQWIFRTDFF